MNAHTTLSPLPQIVAMFAALPVEDQHRALQLMMKECGLAENERELFLSQAAWEIHPHSDDRQDDLYPIGGLTSEAWARHYADAAASVVHAENCVARQMPVALAPVIELARGKVIA